MKSHPYRMAVVREGLIGPVDSIATEAALDRRNDEVIAEIQKKGETFVGAQPGAVAAARQCLTGKRLMRMSSEWRKS